VAAVAEGANRGQHARQFRDHLGKKQNHEDERRRYQHGNRDETAGANEIERRQQAEGQSPQTADQEMIFPDGARQHHPNDIGRQNRLAA
jgi:hypothetical protein